MPSLPKAKLNIKIPYKVTKPVLKRSSVSFYGFLGRHLLIKNTSCVIDNKILVCTNYKIPIVTG